MADMVEGEVARPVAQAEAAAAGMEGRRDPEFQAFAPDRVVIVVAVEAELVVMRREAGDFGVDALGPGQWPPDPAAEHADLGAELFGDEFELLDRLLGGVHRDHRRRGQAVAEVAEIIGRDDVEAADHRAPGLGILDARYAEPRGRIDDAEIDPELVEPVVQHPRHHRGGAVAGVGRLASPIAFHGDAAAAPLVDRERQRVGDAAHVPEQPVRRLVAGRLAHLLGEHRPVFDPMAVGVDDRMGEPGTDLFGVPLFACAHALSSADVINALCSHSQPSAKQRFPRCGRAMRQPVTISSGKNKPPQWRSPQPPGIVR